MGGVMMRATATPIQGFDYRFRAGIPVPRGSGRFVDLLVVDSELDPPGRNVDGKLAIGQASYRALSGDPEIIVGPIMAEVVAAANAESDALRQQVADLNAKLAALQGGSGDGDTGDKDKGKGKGK